MKSTTTKTMHLSGLGVFEKVRNCLAASGVPLTAKAIATLLQIDRADVNSVLYSNQAVFLKLDGNTPLWKLINEKKALPKLVEDRVSLEIVKPQTLRFDLYGTNLTVDYYTYEASRNDGLYKVEIKTPDHILLGLVNTYSQDLKTESLDATQVILLAVGCLDYLNSIDLFDASKMDLSVEISRILKKISAQIS